MPKITKRSKKKFYRVVKNFREVSQNMKKLDAFAEATTELLAQYGVRLKKLKGIDFNKVRRAYPGGGPGPDYGTTPNPKPWPP